MKKLIPFVIMSLLVACAPDKQKQEADPYEGDDDKKNVVAQNSNPAKGLGQVTTVTLNTPLEHERLGRGKAIYEMKCQACHKLSDQRVVGPGWLGVTKRRQPEWIMNMVTNTDMMLDKDPEAQKLLELCLTRMPNQNVSIGDARDILEFMRSNDGEK
ncbi:MAG TPA: cytochrome c [Cyclobacteriaceae bacterium]|nr:cytochrome c [Cyclobacteriaceae bacterium]